MCLYRGRDKYLGEDVLHGHDKALPVVQAEFVVRVTATCEHATDICQEHGAVDAAEHVPDHHRLLYHHFLWLAATHHKVTNIPYIHVTPFMSKIYSSFNQIEKKNTVGNYQDGGHTCIQDSEQE